MIVDLLDTALTSPNGGVAAYGDAALPDIAGHDRFRDLIDLRTGAIGRVVGSEKEPAGGHAFCIWAAVGARSLDVGHVVVAFSEEAAVIGVVDEPRRYSDLRTFLDDYFDRMGEEALIEAQATLRPEILVFTVNVLATKHLRDDVQSHRPPVSGPVWFGTRAAIEYALGTKEYTGVAVPALLHTNGNPEYDTHGAARRNAAGDVVFQRAPIWLDSDYLLGPEAGHANWTGQSGLATKTSHALFLISAAFQRMAADGKKVAALMFNVKGADLLWLDKPADPAPDDADRYRAHNIRGLRDVDRAAYTALGLEPKPFANFRIFAPFKPGQVPDDHAGTVWLDRGDLSERLNTHRTAPDQARGVVHPIAWSLAPLLRIPHRVFERGDLDDKLFGFVAELRDRQIESIQQFEALYEDEIAPSFTEGGSEWHSHHRFTIMKARNRLQGLPAKLNGLLARGHVSYGQSQPKVDAPFSDQELRVVDIAQANTNVQELLVTSVISEIWRLAEKNALGVDKVIVFVDELNKYAPGGGQGGLRDTLVDIAARGRHLNVVLFGAQQFRSKVEDEILGNCGTSFYGRVGDEEIVNAAYRSLSETVKAELLGLPKGKLLVRHAHFRAPLFGAFPLPPTLHGTGGQSVFNPVGGEQGAPHVGDGLWRTLQRIMGDRAPAKRDVLLACQDVDAADVEKLASQLERDYKPNDRRGDPWRKAQERLGHYRRR